MKLARGARLRGLPLSVCRTWVKKKEKYIYIYRRGASFRTGIHFEPYFTLFAIDLNNLG